jgi:hypothetical protein
VTELLLKTRFTAGENQTPMTRYNSDNRGAKRHKLPVPSRSPLKLPWGQTFFASPTRPTPSRGASRDTYEQAHPLLALSQSPPSPGGALLAQILPLGLAFPSYGAPPPESPKVTAFVVTEPNSFEITHRNFLSKFAEDKGSVT